jgi:hypothetical protein
MLSPFGLVRAGRPEGALIHTLHFQLKIFMREALRPPYRRLPKMKNGTKPLLT